MVPEQSFETLDDAAAALACALERVATDAIEARGEALIAVSGGRTPASVFDRLARRDIDWSRVTVTLTDERWVAEDDAHSNAALVRRHLLVGPAAAARFVPLYGGEPDPHAGHDACEARLRALPLPLDAAYLGMGEDGHIASLFPGRDDFISDTGHCVPVPASADRSARMSLTASTLLAARSVFLLFSGRAKHHCYRDARQPGPAADLPVRLLFELPQARLKVLHAP